MPRGRIRWGAAVLVAAALCLAPAPAFAGSPRVAALQAALQAKGLYTAEVDGVPGPMTRAATMRFQRRKRLTVDGVAGPQTSRALGSRGRPRLGSRVSGHSRRSAGTWRPCSSCSGASGFSPGAIDGGFGPGTARAVYAYQRSTGLRRRRHRRAPRRSAPCAAARRPSRLTRALLPAARRARWATASVTSAAAATRASTSPCRAGRASRRPAGASWSSPAGTRAATATSSWSSTGSASPAGTPTFRGSPPAPGQAVSGGTLLGLRRLHGPLDRPAPPLGGAPLRHPGHPAAVHAGPRQRTGTRIGLTASRVRTRDGRQGDAVPAHGATSVRLRYLPGC